MLSSLKTLALALLISGCSYIDPSKASLDREKAKELLLPKINLAAREGSFICEIDPSLASKPELSSLQGKRFCDTSIEVTGIREEGDNKARVDYTITTSFKSGYLEEYSKGIDSLKNRLLSIPGVLDSSAAAIGRSGVVNYTDPTDGRVYSVNVVLGNSTTIDRSPDWRALSEYHGKLNSQIANGASSAENSVPFERYDDGWRAPDFQ